ncbi:MAG: hypothetical protein GY754_15685 [bacterium]|nr:hypothetical protein [bacterium]
MYPELYKFQWLGHEKIIGTYGVLIIIALAATFLLVYLLANQQKLNSTDFVLYALLITASGILGTFITGFIIFLPERLEAGFLTYPPSLVSWGGGLGGLTALSLMIRYWKVNGWNLADIGAVAYLFGVGIGRIGCFFGGCCFGRHTDSVIGVTFTHPIAPAAMLNQPLIPTQLISAAFLILFGLFLAYMVTRRKTPGYIFISGFMVYTVFRFTIEFWRADPRGFFLGLSDGQLYSVGVFSLAVCGLVYVTKNKEKLAATLPYLHKTEE